MANHPTTSKWEEYYPGEPALVDYLLDAKDMAPALYKALDLTEINYIERLMHDILRTQSEFHCEFVISNE
jgi:hypothetical protein